MNPGWAAGLRHPGRTGKLIYGAGAAVLVLLAVVALAGSAQGARNSGPLPMAKSFSLAELGHAGATVSLSSYPGRPVVVNFFASWCAPCKRETPMLARFYAANAGRVVVIGVDANDSQAAALRFLTAIGVRYPVGFDPYPARTTTSYGVYALPQTFFLNSQHRIVKHVVGALTTQELAAGIRLADKKRG